MRYMGLPQGMWLLYRGSFEGGMVTVLGLDAVAAKAVIHDAKPKYRELIAGLPEFERADRFKVNIVSCAMLAAVILNMPKRPDVETLTEFYEKAMMNRLTRWFCHKIGRAHV